MSEALIPVNIYYGKDKKLMESFSIKIGKKITSIDDARILIVNHLDNFYIDVKYKLNIFNTFDDETTINLFFEEDISLNREILLKKILE
jgi:hypothetical protein